MHPARLAWTPALATLVDRWPVRASLCAALTLSLTDANGWVVPSLRLSSLALAAALLAAAALRDLRDPLR